MKAFYVPLAILLLLFFGSLWSSTYVREITDEWNQTSQDIIASMDHAQQREIESDILSLYENWREHQQFLHLIVAHQDLDTAEKYFSGALAACRQNDMPELHIMLAQLASQFEFLKTTQEITLKNIL